MDNIKTMDEKQIKATIDRFQGGDEAYTNDFIGFSYTEGVYWLATNHIPHWFIFGIGIVCTELEGKHPFITIQLKRKGKGVDIAYGDGNGNLLDSKHHKTLTMPIKEINFFYTNKTLLLSNEY